MCCLCRPGLVLPLWPPSTSTIRGPQVSSRQSPTTRGAEVQRCGAPTNRARYSLLATCNTAGIQLAARARRLGRKTQSPLSTLQPRDNRCPGFEAVWQQSVSRSLSGAPAHGADPGRRCAALAIAGLVQHAEDRPTLQNSGKFEPCRLVFADACPTP